LIVTFYGVRGSIPSPGHCTVRYGGNTSCVHVRTRGGRDYIFDAGTGLRRLGQQLRDRDGVLTLLLTHGHSDHIHGLPFFEPLHQKQRHVRVCAPPEAARSALSQFNGRNFPLLLRALPADIACVDDAEAHARADNLTLSRQPLNHPGGGHAYRLAEDGVSIAYVTDNELQPPYAQNTRYEQWVDFLAGADVLIHDAQYRESDMPHKHGWGHSLISQVRQLAWDAGVGTVVIYHHDPDRCDAELDEVRIESEAWFHARGARTACVIAGEGMTLELTARRHAAAGVRVASAAWLA
jgi:phosphoribosyl 1,2-cyclic phosphodiesterase